MGSWLPTINVGDFVGNLVGDIKGGKKKFGGNAVVPQRSYFLECFGGVSSPTASMLTIFTLISCSGLFYSSLLFAVSDMLLLF